VLFVQMRRAGLLMLHAPAWRARQFAGLVCSHLVAGALALVAAVGIIGLPEMVHVTAACGAATKRLLWLSVAPRTLTPWLGFAALVLMGALDPRLAGSPAAAAFTEASRTVAVRAAGAAEASL
jgi:hypothetical protein